MARKILPKRTALASFVGYRSRSMREVDLAARID
jgi:hypothetical protein